MIGGRYSRDREIGRGGMGAVWLGRDEVLGREVAIKRVGMMPGGSSPDLLRAEREARIAASLNHAHVVAIFDLVHDGEQQWLIMEYFAGTTLGDLVRSEGKLSPGQLTPILAQVAQALAAAHAAGIVHRDVKPSNILVREDGQAKITDFGIARAGVDESLTQTGLVTGSPAYLPPEIASGQHASAASDVWSLGATVFHALSGHPPYEVGDNVLGALYRIVNEVPPRLDDAGELDVLLRATMVHNPDARWSMDDVVRFLDGLPSSSAARAPAGRRIAAPHDDDLGTQILRPAPVAPAPTPPTPPTPPTRPTASPAAAAPTSRAAAPHRRRMLPVLLGALVFALVITIAVLALTDDPQRDTDVGGAPQTGGTTTPPSSSPPSPSESSPTDPPTSEAMESFVASYVDTASSDPDRGFDQLTPAFQEASGGIEGYRGFWGKVSNAVVEGIETDPEDLQVTYRYSYDYPGKGRLSESVSLQLVRRGDGFLIDGPV